MVVYVTCNFKVDMGHRTDLHPPNLMQSFCSKLGSAIHLDQGIMLYLLPPPPPPPPQQ